MKKPLVFQVGIISRGKGTCTSAVDAAAYILGEKWKSEYDGKTYDHSSKSEEVVYTNVLAPTNTHEFVFQPYTLVHAIEWSERKKNAQLLRSIYFSLPPELTREQQIAVLNEYVERAFVSKGMVAIIALHDAGTGNPNAHILLTMREILPDGSFLLKAKGIPFVDEKGELIRSKNGKCKMRKVCLNDWNYQGNGEMWRNMCAETINKSYQLAGLDIVVDHRSPKRQGLSQLSPVYINPAEHQSEQCGERTEVGDLNRWIKEENKRRANYEARKQKIDQILENYLSTVKGLSRREQYKSPQTRATQQFWADLHAIEEQCKTGTPSPGGHHAQATRRERDPSSEME